MHAAVMYILSNATIQMHSITFRRLCNLGVACRGLETDDEHDAAEADYDADAENDLAAGSRGGRSNSARARGRGRRITGPGITPLSTEGLGLNTGLHIQPADAAAAAEGDMTPGSRGKGSSRLARGTGRWNNRKSGGSRGSRGGSATPRAGDAAAAAGDDLDSPQAGPDGQAEPEAPAAAAVAGGSNAAVAAADLGEAAEALLGIGMGIEPEYHRPAAVTAAMQDGVSVCSALLA